MEITDLLAEDTIVLSLRAQDKAALLHSISELAAGKLGAVSSAMIEAALRSRESLGSTGLGGGFALPHSRIKHIDRFFCMLVRLAHPIDYQAIDGKPVDIACLLLLPTEQASRNMAALAAVSRCFRDSARLTAVRNAFRATEVLGLLRS